MLIEIHLHDGLVIQETVASYDENAILTDLNSSATGQMIAFGKTILNKHVIKLIRPIAQEEPVA